MSSLIFLYTNCPHTIIIRYDADNKKQGEGNLNEIQMHYF